MWYSCQILNSQFSPIFWDITPPLPSFNHLWTTKVEKQGCPTWNEIWDWDGYTNATRCLYAFGVFFRSQNCGRVTKQKFIADWHETRPSQCMKFKLFTSLKPKALISLLNSNWSVLPARPAFLLTSPSFHGMVSGTVWCMRKHVCHVRSVFKVSIVRYGMVQYSIIIIV